MYLFVESKSMQINNYKNWKNQRLENNIHYCGQSPQYSTIRLQTLWSKLQHPATPTFPKAHLSENTYLFFVLWLYLLIPVVHDVV
jgi:hypothetical protein